MLVNEKHADRLFIYGVTHVRCTGLGGFSLLIARAFLYVCLGTGLTYALSCRYDQHRRVQIEQIEVGESVLRECHMVQYINV